MKHKGYENKEIPSKFCEITYAFINFRLQVKKQGKGTSEA